MPTVRQHAVQEELGQSTVSGQTVHTADGTIRDTRQADDGFSVSEEDRKEWGIRENESLYWARDPQTAMWAKHEPSDRIRQLQRAYPGSRVVHHKGDFDRVTCGDDLCLVAIPTELYSRHQDDIDAKNTEYEHDLSPMPSEEGHVGTHQDMFDRTDVRYLTAKARAEHEYNVRAGIVGGSSPTAGMPLMQAEALMRRRGIDIDQVENEYRSGPVHQEMNQDAFRKMVLGQSKQGKSFAVGGATSKRNPNSPLAQAAARERGAK